MVGMCPQHLTMPRLRNPVQQRPSSEIKTSDQGPGMMSPDQDPFSPHFYSKIQPHFKIMEGFYDSLN